jgi:hypothetical protein
MRTTSRSTVGSTCNVAVNLNSTCEVNVDVFVEVNGDRRNASLDRY